MCVCVCVCVRVYVCDAYVCAHVCGGRKGVNITDALKQSIAEVCTNILELPVGTRQSSNISVQIDQCIDHKRLCHDILNAWSIIWVEL